MKKLLAIFIAVILLFAAAGCTAKEINETGEAQNEEKNSFEEIIKNEWTETSNCKFRVLECVYDEALTGQDEEYFYTKYGVDERNWIFVDLVIELENIGTVNITEDNFSGYFVYKSCRHDMDFSIEPEDTLSARSDPDTVIPAGDRDIIHLYSTVEKEAEGTDITVIYTVDGKEYEEKVTSKKEADLLTSKSEVKVGDVVDVNGRYEFEVLSCKVAETMFATNATESQPYSSFDTPVVDLVIKVKNNTNLVMEKMKPYVIIDDTILEGHLGIEVENNTIIVSSQVTNGYEVQTIEAGEEEICHLYVLVKNEYSTENTAVRFNIDGNCYYCKAV